MFFAGIADEAGATIERQVAAHRELGWHHIEIRLVNGVNLTAVDDATFEHVVEVVGEAGMQVCSFASTLGNWARPVAGDFAIDVAELERAIPRMHRLNCQFIRCMSWPNKGETLVTPEAWRAESIRRMKVLAKMAEDGGITLIHENCDGWGGDSPANTLALLAEVNSPALKTVFDTGNPFMHRQDAVDFLKQTIDHVVHVHIKDGYLGEGDKHVFTYPNEGSCHVQECLRILIEHGYDAGYSIEPHVAAIVHTGEGLDQEDAKYASYLKYGRQLMAVYEAAKAEAAVRA